VTMRGATTDERTIHQSRLGQSHGVLQEKMSPSRSLWRLKATPIVVKPDFDGVGAGDTARSVGSCCL
jgi:hypothetical protein